MTTETGLTFVGDASCIICVNFMRQGLAWGRVQRCFALAAHVDSKVVLYGDNGHCSPVKKSKMVYYGCLEAEEEMTSVMLAGDVSRVTRQGPTRGPVRWCFELTAHVDDVAVFGYGRQWSKVSSDKKGVKKYAKQGQSSRVVHCEEGLRGKGNDPKLYG